MAMTEKETIDRVKDDVNAAMQNLLAEKVKLQRDNDQLKMQVKELETRLKDETHEFKRKQIGMSTLVTVLMDARFGEGGEVFIGRDEFVRLASDAAAAAEDIAMLRMELEKTQDEMRLMRSSTITHKMAIQESTGLRLAEIIGQRDRLKRALRQQASEDTTGEIQEMIDRLMEEPLVKKEEPERKILSHEEVKEATNKMREWMKENG
jgi:hypothetical protein